MVKVRTPFCSGPMTRRDILQAGYLSLLTSGFGPLLLPTVSQAACNPSGFGQAKSCIFLFMWGGPSQLETWDLKPNAPAEIRGEFKPIATTVPGIHISEHFPRLARQAHLYTIIRSMTHQDPAHLSSVHHLMTGRHAPKFPSDADPPSRKDWPHLGSYLLKMRPNPNPLPGFITLPWTVMHPAAPGGQAPGQNGGWLGRGFDPFVIQGDPSQAGFQVSGLRLPAHITPDEMSQRRSLLSAMESQSRLLRELTDGLAMDAMQKQALDALGSKQVRDAFNLQQEAPKNRERYGMNIHGQSVLLARRLVERGVPFVAVNWHQDHHNFWDTHGNNFNRLKNDLMPPADMAFSALLDDLHASGRLKETLIVWVGEFGRNPKITANSAGREHWPQCYSAVLAGGGMRGGYVYGRSDSMAAHPAENPVSPADLTATVYYAMGIDPTQSVRDREDRPIRLTEGDPLTSLFS